MDTQVESSAEPDSAIINHDDRECNKADVESAVSSDLSDRDTLALFPPTRPVTPAIESEYRELGLTTIGSPPWNAKYDVITVHGLRDDHKHVWKSENGSPWLQQQLLSNIPSRQVDYLYATDSTARIFRPDGIELEAQNLLRLYAENRRLLSPSEVGRPIIWVCHDIGGCIVKQVLLEASKATLREKSIDLEASRTRIALHSSTIIFLGCPHRTMSIEIFEDELHNLLKLPGPDIETGFLRKIKNLAHQVCNINMLFLDGKFLSRFVYINVFAVKDFNVDETTTAENAILEPATHATLPSEVESDTRDGFCDETVSNVAGLEATDGPVEFSPDVPFVRSPDLRADQSNIQARSTAQLHSERDTLNHNQSCHAAWVDLPVGRASPFSRYTSDIYIMFDNVHADFHNDHASLTRGGPWVDIVQRQLRADQRYLGAHPPDLTNELALLYMAPCTKPPTVHHDPNVFKISFLKWIYAHEKFKTFDRSVGPYTLCIQGVKEDVARMAMVSQHLYLRYEDEKCKNPPPGLTTSTSTFYFQFDQFDSRCNSIKAMLAKFLAEVIWHLRPNVNESQATYRTFWILEMYNNWSLPVLFGLFMNVRALLRAQQLTIFLSCFDNCVEDERVWFIRNVLDRQMRSDPFFRLIITTCDQDPSLNECLPISNKIFLSEYPAPLTGYTIDEGGYNAGQLKQCLEDVLRKRQAFTRLRTSLEVMITKYQRAPYLGYIVLDWLRNYGRGVPITDVAAVITKLHSATPQNVLTTVLHSIRPCERNKAHTIYKWVRNAAEPMTLEALGQALAVSLTSTAPLFDIDYDQLLQDITRTFAGIIVVEGCNIRFSHESFYSTTISSIDGGDEDPSVAHGFLSEACLKYLMHEEVQPEYARLSIDSLGKNALKTPLLRQHDFLEYSVQFWAKHYHSCCPSNQPMALALRFFDTTNVRNKWAEAHYLLSNPFTRIHRGYFSSLPMTAALGLEDILSQQLADYGDSDWLTTDTWLAITEAARNGHNNIVYRLLENAALQESNLLDAINWAASSSNQLALARLLEKVALLGKFSWTRPLLQRAVALGHDSLISVLIGTEQYLDERDDLEMDQILREAISWEQQAAVKLLLESGVSIDTRDNNGRTVLHLSANMGQPEVVQMLLDAGADVNDKDSQGLSAIDIAINSGTHKALARLLEAGILNDNSKPEGSSFDVRGYLTRACNFGRIHCIRVLVEKLEHLEGGSDIDEILYTLCGFPHTADSCRFLIGRGAKPQQLHTEQEMLLHRALKTGDTDLIRLLVEKGAEMTYVDKQNDDTTPLSFAIWKCSLDVVELLLQMGASANYVPEDTDSPLFVACYQATDTRKVELLLKHGAEINWKKDDGWTALHGAYDLPAFVSILLDNGADVNGMSDYGTPLMMAARWNYVDVLKRLLAHSDIKVNLKFERDDDSKQEVTALFEAVEQGSHDCANLLIEAGAEIDERLGSAKFLLESAKLDGSEECSKMMRTFLNRGINIDNTDDEGNTTLHGVGSMTPVWIIQDMVERGAPIDSPNNDGLTPLGVTVERGNVAAAEYLISKGARVNIYGSRFGSLLHLAFQANRPENISFQLLKILIDAHADPNLPGPEPSRESLLYKVIRNINSGMEEKVVTYLVNNADPALDVNAPGGSQSHPIMAAAYTGKRRILEYLVRHGANVQVRDDLGRQTIHYLSGRGRWNYIMRPIRILDKSGADLMAKDSFGRTALHFLAGSDDVTLLEFFLRRLPKGHDIDLKDDDGWTPLMWACRTSDETMIINILVRDHGADIWAKSYDGEWSARKLACLSNQSEYSRGLLEPAEHEREREGTDGSKEIWDPAFHSIPPGTNHPSAPWCNSCFVIMVGARYKCFVCDDYDLCFKCYPQRTDMHDEYHDFGEYHEDAFLYQDESNTSETDQSVDDESRASDEAGATSDAPHVDAGDGGDGSLRSEHSDL
ncbi:Serine/threonine-protein phosphatase 6 regulatory ankyrin repeat subunit A [Colletotrichum fructicola]|nr:Serine/threonine-protein phosphatase 6 regulatory ankyrin repeat subunit A [Colletotrichum fructicola]KAF4932485.1 Serine/threonine-protein phosphatase 6 regulatory ankyrin repeat subunit A [Colletotrichum fructicola]